MKQKQLTTLYNKIMDRVFADLGMTRLSEATAPKNVGRTSKFKSGIKKRLQGGSEAPVDATPAPETETAPEGKQTPKNIGNGRKHRAAISTHLRSKFKPAAEEEAPGGKMFDDIEIPEESDEEITGQDDSAAVDAAVEDQLEKDEGQLEKEEDVEIDTPVANQSRLLTIDRTKINKQLKELSLEPAPHVPINKIKEVLAKFDLKLINDDGRDFDGKLVGVDGNTDIELAYKNGKRVGNSAMVLFWHQIERTDMYEFHAYLS